jgi:hypothetical protein
LQAAIDGGLIEETHYLDAKAAAGSTKGDNRELARDLASLAVDGGTLLYGIQEDKANGRFSLAPLLLSGLSEKIEQVARSIPDPPLNVITTAIVSTAEDPKGYLIVHIPASPAAPHMVDGRYLGRGDKTKTTLSDAEVVRLHERRRSSEQDALALLEQETADDPMLDVGEQSHLFLVAQPLSGRPDMLLDFTSGPDWNMRLLQLMESVARDQTLNTALRDVQVSPTWSDAGNGYRRAHGVARATSNIGTGRRYTTTPDVYGGETALEIQVQEDGGLRLFMSRFSDALQDDKAEQVIIDPAAVNFTRRFLALVVATAQQAGYLGNWSLAFGATRLRDRAPYTPNGSWAALGPTHRYNKDSFARSTGATWAELQAAPGAITNRLLGPLLRSLGVDARYQSLLTD